MNLAFKSFLQTSIPLLISIFYAKEGYHDFLLKFFCLTVLKNLVEEHYCVSEKFWYRNFSCIRGGAVSGFSVVIINLQNVGKGWDSSPYLQLQNLVVLPTVPWEPVEFLTNVSEIIKTFVTIETRTRSYCLRNFYLTPLLSFIFE